MRDKPIDLVRIRAPLAHLGVEAVPSQYKVGGTRQQPRLLQSGGVLWRRWGARRGGGARWVMMDVRVLVASLVVSVFGCGVGSSGGQGGGGTDADTGPQDGVLAEDGGRGDAGGGVDDRYGFTHLAVGRAHSCALRGDARILCWGANEMGQSAAPDGPFTSVSAYGDTSCALRPDGAAVCWGNLGPEPDRSLSPPPGPFTEIAPGRAFSCGVRQSGDVECWGNFRGEPLPTGLRGLDVGEATVCGILDGQARCHPLVAPDGAFVQVSTGNRYACGIRGGGHHGIATCWPEPRQGDAEGTLSPPQDVRFAKIAMGHDHGCGIGEDDELTCWGAGRVVDVDRCAAGESSRCGQAQPPPGRFVDVAAGGEHTCAIRKDGGLECWGAGSGEGGELDRGQSLPPGVDDDGEDSDGDGVTLAGGDCDDTDPGRAPGLAEICDDQIDQDCDGQDVLCADLDQDGDGFTRRMGDCDDSDPEVYRGAEEVCGNRRDENCDGRDDLCCPDEDQDGYQEAGCNEMPQWGGGDCDDGNASIHPAEEELCGDGRDSNCDGRVEEGCFVQVSAGGSHSCAIRTDGMVTCWGRVVRGAEPPPGRFTQISAAHRHTCGVRDNGTVACWGSDARGQSSAPAGNFTQVSVGFEHTCGVRDDGIVACWGSNEDNRGGHAGQAMPPDGRFIQVSAGLHHTCGLRVDNTIACWGWDVLGQASPAPGQFIHVDAGGHFTCGARDDATVVCWGSNERGAATPPEVRADRLSAGLTHACAIREGGVGARCWGSDAYGQASLRNAGRFVQVSAGYNHTCGVTDDGAIKCHGSDDAGQSSPPRE